MGKFGDSAVLAVKSIINGNFSNPSEAWDTAIKHFIPAEKSTAKKSCPKNTFLGLCEEGYVKGISPGKYARGKLRENKGYAIQALRILQKSPHMGENKARLWKKIADSKSENNQMDVVIALWDNDLLETIKRT